MREIVSTALIVGAVALLATAAQAAPRDVQPPQQLAAASAARYGVQASYTGPQLEVGYSAGARHIADCLASFPGYNPRTDQIRSPSGAVQRCRL
jgi:hypothetical protein